MEKDKVLCWKRYKAADADCDATDTIPIPPVIKAAIIANIFRITRFGSGQLISLVTTMSDIGAHGCT